ncbi:hypothetical protein H704_00650 [Bartonella bacilliformis Peru38]|uniref:Uncharacterized protein n=2 Tax=Bartonella bacilliformis TaxID=774 RepID=A1USS2_BARBK|nr:hypothetical protein BARBAKC583_0725 [Bartonella bacilliformis KC583]AUV47280.1 hypothetical protein AL467_06395 [Bartonella bacilliformis]EKS44628.1 hypothetical protein BbINS_03417 [Bartonella bacilliformis INS]EYS89973.1 hypothetical protein X472_00424 [Bartonella bacilliformis San Pedro600-02]EYS95316.1 hypothetical protein X470_00844 [Bartonella bacilliformis Peru-18]KEG17385.1 hypothetical protein H709_00736 [Bartonella bacilliformis CUSCO5]KEG20413.1 hypothetical protein H704_00650 
MFNLKNHIIFINTKHIAKTAINTKENNLHTEYLYFRYTFFKEKKAKFQHCVCAYLSKLIQLRIQDNAQSITELPNIISEQDLMYSATYNLSYQVALAKHINKILKIPFEKILFTVVSLLS